MPHASAMASQSSAPRSPSSFTTTGTPRRKRCAAVGWVRTPMRCQPFGVCTDTANSLRTVLSFSEKRMPVITPLAGVPRSISLSTRRIDGDNAMTALATGSARLTADAARRNNLINGPYPVVSSGHRRWIDPFESIANQAATPAGAVAIWWWGADVRCSRMVRGFVVVAVVAMSVACDDDGSPSDAPTETPGTGSGGSVTTVPADTPSGGSGAVEPGTNLVPSSDAGPPGSGSQDPGLGASQTTAGG